MTNLLVVDWDHFFVNPLEGGVEVGDKWVLYDWGHSETPFMLGPVWAIRAQGFMENDLPLPSVQDTWKTFASRFRLADDAEILYADSNMWAGDTQTVGVGYEEVWLFDAHHDLYKFDSLDAWQASATEEGIRITCEDWMFVHAHGGSKLRWFYPDWHESWSEIRDNNDYQPPKGVHLEWGPDDPTETFQDIMFDDVFICRSGAWVPPWCDDEFEQFLGTWGRDVTQVDNVDMDRSGWKESLVAHRQAIAELTKARGDLG